MKIQTYDGKIYDASCRGYAAIVNGRNKFKKELSNCNHELLSSYINVRTPVIIDFKCGHGPQIMNPSSYMRHNEKTCPLCRKGGTPYIDDVYTKHPELLKYFVNPKDAIGLPSYSRKIVKLKCPICGEIKYQQMNDLTSAGYFTCPTCADSVSYPEKVMTEILTQLNIDFVTRKKPEWCEFVLNGNKCIGLYDFIIESKKLIIEMDGGLHYLRTGDDIEKFNNRKERDRIKDILAKEHGYNIIRVDCNYKDVSIRFEYIKDNIIKSCSCVLNLSFVDWNKIFNIQESSILSDVASLWKTGYTVDDISKITKIARSTIRRYLKRGTELGLCEYTQRESKTRMGKRASEKCYMFAKAEIVETGELLGVFWNLHIFLNKYNEQFPDKKLTAHAIQYNIQNVSGWKITKGLKFKNISREEYIDLLNNPHLITDDGNVFHSLYYNKILNFDNLKYEDFFILPEEKEQPT